MINLKIKKLISLTVGLLSLLLLLITPEEHFFKLNILIFSIPLILYGFQYFTKQSRSIKLYIYESFCIILLLYYIFNGKIFNEFKFQNIFKYIGILVSTIIPMMYAYIMGIMKIEC